MLLLINGSSCFPAALYCFSSCGINSVTSLSGAGTGYPGGWHAVVVLSLCQFRGTVTVQHRCGGVSWKGSECLFPSVGHEMLGFMLSTKWSWRWHFFSEPTYLASPSYPVKGLVLHCPVCNVRKCCIDWSPAYSQCCFGFKSFSQLSNLRSAFWLLRITLKCLVVLICFITSISPGTFVGSAFSWSYCKISIIEDVTYLLFSFRWF